MPPTIWPAVWAAISATFSAMAAIVLMVVHLRNRADSVRPEIILEDWSYFRPAATGEPFGGLGVIRINKVRNEGKGPALHMRGQITIPGAKYIDAGGPFGVFSHDPVPIISPGARLDVDWCARFQWKGAVVDNFLPLHLTLFVADLHGRRHETTYELIATKDNNVAGVTPLVPGLYLTRRHSAVMSVLRLRLLVRGIRLVRDTSYPQLLTAMA